MSRIATVFGATGLQGGSVIRQLLEDGTFKPRGVTRNTTSDSAKALSLKGVDVFEGDLDNYESIQKAVAGAEVVFALTMPYGKGVGEVQQGKYIVDAAKEAGVNSAESISKISGGKYKAGPLDDKAEVDDYLRASGIPNSILLTGVFLENWVRKEFPDCVRLDENGEIATMARWVPGSLAPLSWIERDLGLAVSALFNAYSTGRLSEINGKDYVVSCAKVPIEEWYKAIETTLGKKVNVTWLPTVNMKMIDDMYDCGAEFPWYADKQLPDPGLVALGVKVGTLEDFARTVVKSHLGL
ncbi:NmrA-domain-containing protein [Exidia glandulosa HHB12029]|uniref:NmrA-domain-containing protein n=1 Tax=Exidia glandulosa HHB12029 TaxID=1314781 RepID=A0A165FD20_EXIGL|nr:NmrA-domain-containing protein [Exidia glandulosa HHB12029]